jgi:phosphate/sulfate permease
METIYLVIVIVLVLLAVSDLVVGVSNDAVNFLNSAIGSKVAPLKVILAIAALGIIIGATFSGGMMEVARKGIFHPEHFYFSEIMIIFLAVMITDVILLDTFNTYGMPTSTTVSIVFELLGAAVAVSLLKIYTDPNSLDLGQYINSGKALAIISGILLSVVIAFTIGAIVQYIARLLFSFNYKRNLKYFGAIWGGIAITAITYFMLIKGAKDASFMSDGSKDFIKHNSMAIIGISFVGWTVLLQLISMITKLNILKFIVFIGTFALAMAFAGNDLVNFIGVPLAGYASYMDFIANPGAQPDAFLMSSLTGSVQTPTLFLLLAGLIMVITLWTSKKARSVTKTEINLARQDAGYERFGSTAMSRALVRGSNNLSKSFNAIIPEAIQRKIEKQFDQREYNKQQKALGDEAPYFDMIRASVNLVVASILISFATSMKLPLSTTYVTFMVAMGTSLSDKAWGRDSAVYRITGVVSVIGGWFFTAFSAFTLAFLIAMAIKFGGFVAILILVGLAVFFVYRTHIIHKRRSAEDEPQTSTDAEEIFSGAKMLTKCSNSIVKVLAEISEILLASVDGLSNENLKLLRKTQEDVKKLNKSTKSLKDNISKTIAKFDESSIENGQFYVQSMDYLREMAHSISFLNKPMLDHVDNNHKALLDVQIEELNEIVKMLRVFTNRIVQMIKTKSFAQMDGIIQEQQELLKFIDATRKKQVKRIKTNEVGTRNSMLYLGLLSEYKSLALHMVNLAKSFRDFSNSI